MTTSMLFDNPKRVRNRIDTLLDIAEKQGYSIELVDGCCEPGYADKPVTLADWNERSHWDNERNRFVTDDNTMPRLVKLFEKLGYEIEWEDEWAVCDECGKAVRTQPNSYSWKPYYWLSEAFGLVCGDCVKESPEDYLASLSGKQRKCLTFSLDLSQYGYTLYSSGHENGWHKGQDADPKEIAKELRAEGVTDFIFVLDDQGQFGIEFSVWIKQGESEND